MNIVLVAAVTADGFIARNAGHAADWTSKDDKRHFVEVTKRLGTMVMGSTTFETIGRALPGRRMIVLTNRPDDFRIEGVETFSGPVESLVAALEKEGVAGLAVVGGAHVYGQFLEAGLVDRLELTVEPHLFGKGITVAGTELDLKLRLLGLERLGEQAVLITYEVER
nr:Dihydrofolate reductase [uncultured bacterium]AIA15803.1 Dihydrofolate reductase [uncultured bacterium]